MKPLGSSYEISKPLGSVMLQAAFLLLSLFVLPAWGAIFTDPSQLKTATYDFIVVGGQWLSFMYRTHINFFVTAGAGGGVVASRLSENPAFKVLLIEAGPTYAASTYQLTSCVYLPTFKKRGPAFDYCPIFGTRFATRKPHSLELYNGAAKRTSQPRLGLCPGSRSWRLHERQ